MHTTRLMMPLSTSNHAYSQRWQQTLACMLVPLVIWFCVLASIRYGYYGNSRLVLGPSSSRLMKTSSVLVEKVEVRNDHNNLVLYAFNEKPQLISQTNWTTSRFLILPRYTRKGFSLWLNKGSRIRMRWEAQASSRNLLEGVVIKGERRFEKMEPQQTFSPDTLATLETINGNEAEYMIEEDDRYQIGVLNMNDKNIVLKLNVNVSAKVYDTTKANNIYSSVNGSCTLSLLFPNTYYVILTASKNVDDDDDGEWFVEVSFIARVVAYIAILGLCIIVIFVILRCLGGYDNDDHNTNVTIDTSNNNNVLVSSSQESRNEITEPMIHHHVKPNPMRHRTKNDEEEESSEVASSCSSEELYDEKLCVICYDEQRNCFFVPCGHSATCFDCAKRIVGGESKVCPVCRRLIHKVRRLFMS